MGPIFAPLRKEAARPDATDKSLSGLTGSLQTAAVLAVSLLLFLMVRQSTFYMTFPDENFDYMEQAYRLLHGYGTPTWTYELGMRSWIYPGLLAGAMWIGSLLGRNELFFAHGLVALSSLIPVWCAIQWARWIGVGRLALLAGILTATWFDVVYWSSVTLSEIFAGNLLCLCVHEAFCYLRSGEERRLVRLGAALGLVFAIRFHFTPYLIVLAALACQDQRRRWKLVIASALVMILLSGLLDWMTLGLPFQSVWLNLLVNSKVPISQYGMAHQPIYYLTDLELSYWQWGTVLLLVYAAASFDVFPGLGVMAGTIWLVQSLLPNQQIRFLYPALILVVIAASIGAVRTVHFYRHRLGGWAAAGLPAAACLTWIGLSAYLALHGLFRFNWQHRSGYLAAADYIHAHDDVCGLAMLAGTYPVFGQSYIGRPIPVRLGVSKQDVAALRPYMNAVLLSEAEAVPMDYRLVACWPDGYLDARGNYPAPRVCLSKRPGRCQQGAPSQPAAWPPAALQFSRFASRSR